MLKLESSQRWVVRGFLCGMVVLYCATFGALSLLKHEALETSAFDLGNMDQLVWNTIHGRPFHLTNIEGTDIYLARHLSPILLPLSLLYFIYSGPQVLLLVQTLLVALGAVPLFWIARKRFGDQWASLLFVASFLLYPALEGANLFDFHTVVLAPVFLLFAFHFMEGKNYRLFFTFAILAIFCREDMGRLVFAMGVYLSLAASERRMGLLAAILGLLWFLVATFLVIPRFSPKGESPFLTRYYGYLGTNTREILETAFSTPWLILRNFSMGSKLAYLRDLLLPVAFTSLFSPQTLFLCLPSLTINLLSRYPPMGVLEGFHYPAPLVPFVFISSIYGISFLADRGKRYLPRRKVIYLLSGLVFLSSLFYHRYRGFTSLAVEFQWPAVTEHDRLAHEFIAIIPRDAAVSAQSHLNPHLSQREKIYMFPRVEDAEFVFFDVSVDSWPIHPNDQKRLFDTLLGEEGFGILAAKDGYILLQRGLSHAQELPEGFYDFARVEDPQIEYPMVVDFGGLLRFLGFNLDQEKGMTSLALYWQALVPLGGDYRIYPFFDDEEGRIIEDTTLRPMTTVLWYPTSRWKVGEIVKMETLPWDVGGDFNVGLGVMGGESWRMVEDRLPLEVVTSTLVVRTLDEGTAVRLLKIRDGFPQPIWRSFQAPKVPSKLRVTLGRSVLLLGYNLTPSTLRPGDRLSLTLYWEALGEVEKDYTVFVHLLDGGERIWGQRDSFPLGGLRPTTTWMEGEYLIDEYRFSVQPDAPPGEYLIEVGMYDASNGERLPIYEMDGERLPGDRVLLDERLTVRP